MAKKEIIKALEEAGRRMREAMVDKLISERLLKTGALGRSVQDTVDIDPNNGVATLSISMLDYGIFQDSGVYGSNPAKNQVIPNAESLFSPGQFKSKVIGGPLPFAVRRSIAEKGLKPRPFILPSITQNQPYIEESLEAAAGIDLDIEITDLANKYGVKVET